jgi:hypothetical protein
MLSEVKYNYKILIAVSVMILVAACSDSTRNEKVKSEPSIEKDIVKPKRNLSDTTLLNFVLGSSYSASVAHIRSLIRNKKISDKVIYHDKFLGLSFSGYKYNFPINDYNSYETLLMPSYYKGKLMKLEFLFYGSHDKLSLLSLLESKFDKPIHHL